jgi:2'-5' RNA ligase
MKFQTDSALKNLYIQLNTEGNKAIRSCHELIDPALKYPGQDRRFGLTLLIPLKGTIARNLCQLSINIGTIEPEQYLYPQSDLHVTVLDLIGAHEGFEKEEKKIRKSVKVIKEAAHDLSPFEIKFKGLIATPAAILAKGYCDSSLQLLRRRIRERAAKEDFNLQERYETFSSHATIVRFGKKLKNREKLLAFIHENCDFEIGTTTVKEMHLVVHDWYNRRKEIIEMFTLKK